MSENNRSNFRVYDHATAQTYELIRLRNDPARTIANLEEARLVRDAMCPTGIIMWDTPDGPAPAPVKMRRVTQD